MARFLIQVVETVRYALEVEAEDMEAAERTGLATHLATEEGSRINLGVDDRSVLVEHFGFYRVHHDMLGWYIVAPRDREPEDGRSLGFDGRRHFASEAEAWAEAEKRAQRAARRVSTFERVTI